MSLANKLVRHKNKEQRARKLMLKGEKEGNWHSTKRAASLLDGRIAQTEKFIKGNS